MSKRNEQLRATTLGLAIATLLGQVAVAEEAPIGEAVERHLDDNQDFMQWVQDPERVDTELADTLETREVIRDQLGTIKLQGLVPAIAQDWRSGEVLMLAWMNREAIERTLAEGYACYYSRSRQAMWRKGETSGHLQALKSLRFDCDGDAILLTVEQTGPACHTGEQSCFFRIIASAADTPDTDPSG